MATIGGSDIVRSGLVLNLDAASRRSYPGSGTSWRDVSGNNNNGTLTNGPTFTTSNGGGISFDGTDDFVDLGNSSAFNITSVNNYTISIWFYNGFPNFGIGLVHKGPGPSDYDYMIYVSGASAPLASRVIAFYKKTSGGTGFGTSGLSIEPYNTYNYCVVLSSNSVLEYLNGVLLSTSATTGDVRTSSNTLKIGRGWLGTINGIVFSNQIYTRSLSSQEILQNYNAQKSRFGL